MLIFSLDGVQTIVSLVTKLVVGFNMISVLSTSNRIVQNRDASDISSLPMVLGALKFMCWLAYGVHSADVRLSLVSCFGSSVFVIATACFYTYSLNKASIRMQLAGAALFYFCLLSVHVSHGEMALLVSR